MPNRNLEEVIREGESMEERIARKNKKIRKTKKMKKDEKYK